MKPFQGEILKKYKSFVFCGLMVVSAVASAQSQDQQDQGESTPDPQAQDQTQEQIDAAVLDGDKKPKKLAGAPETKTLYFIGPKLQSMRQQGPSVGAPVSITPKPLVAIGSIVVQTPPQADAEQVPGEGPLLKESDLAGPIDAEGADQLNPNDPARPNIDGPDDAEAGLVLPVLSTDADGADSAGQDGIQEGALEQIDPSGLRVSGLSNPIDTVWQGYDRTEIQTFLQRLARPSFSPTLTRLAASIAGSRFSLPAPSGQDDVLKIIEARLAVFEATSNVGAYTSLLEGLPVDADWSALASHTARAHLLKGELTDACLIAETERVGDTNPYWVRLAAFCMAATGNRSGVDFQLGILEETTALEPVFYQLLDQILVEAEQPPGAILSDPVTLNGSLQTDILTVAMARLSRATIPEIDPKGLNPLSIPMLLENPSLSTEAQAMLIAYLMERGIGQEEAIATFARSFSLQDGEAAAALTMSELVADGGETDSGVNADTQEPDLPEENAPVVSEDRLQAILLAVIAGAGDPDQRTLAFGRFWERASDDGKLVAVAPILNVLTRNNPLVSAGPVPKLDGYSARAAMLLGDKQSANSWSRKLRTTIAGQDADTDAALIALWPLLALQEEMIAENSAARLNLWWQQQSDSPDGFEQANLLFSVTDAVSGNVSEALWSAVAQGPAAFGGVIISPALWRKFELSVQAKDPVTALTSLYQLLSEVGSADLPPTISGVLVSGLVRLGFEDTATALALEILISQKL